MTGLSAGDFTALADFPLLWRWTSPTHAVLPAAALATIRPLTALAAAAISHEAVRRCADEVKADDVVEIDAAASDSAVRERLAALDVGADDAILVSWSPSLALLTRWETFVRYWDAFCYPSSDDVTVWALESDWTLCYWHFEQIDFRRRQAAI